MSQEIEAWCSIVRDCIPELFNSEKFARQHAENYGGTVVRLSGKMPEKPIERKATAWVGWCEPKIPSMYPFEILGVDYLSPCRTERCRHKVEIIVRELPEEGD